MDRRYRNSNPCFVAFLDGPATDLEATSLRARTRSRASPGHDL